jgi:transposase
MIATHNRDVTTKANVLYLAFELGDTDWKLAFTIGLGQPPRLRSMPARDLARLQAEIAKAKQRFQLPADALVQSCYEAGRDGFWLHRNIVPVPGFDGSPVGEYRLGCLGLKVDTNRR